MDETRLTPWGRVTHICVGNLAIIAPDNGLSPGRRQAIIWTNAGILLIGPSGTNFSEILIGIQTFSFKKIHLKMSSAKWRPVCLGLNVLRCLSGPINLHTSIALSQSLPTRLTLFLSLLGKCCYLFSKTKWNRCWLTPWLSNIRCKCIFPVQSPWLLPKQYITTKRYSFPQSCLGNSFLS